MRPEKSSFAMKALRTYDIHIYKLSNGEHEYEFDLSDSFFELFDSELVRKGKLKAFVTLQKSDSMIQINFTIKGEIELTCDRSLDLFDYPLEAKRGMIYKYGDEEKELSEDVYVILKDTQTLNIASILFEFIGLEIPMKKLHPRFEVDEDSDEEVEMIYSSIENNTEEQAEEPIDPRWAALKNLNKKK